MESARDSVRHLDQQTTDLPDVAYFPTINLSRTRVFSTVAGAMLSLSLAAVDITIVATALPRIVADLGGISQISWVVTAYLIMSTTLVPIVGRVSDAYGRKPLLIIGILIFLAGSMLSGLSQNMLQLILFRGVQGSGAAFLIANTFTVVGDLFPPAERGKWQGLMGAVFGIGSMVGPLAGGYLTDNLSWRWIFYVNLPVGLLALLVLAIAMPPFETRDAKRTIDYLGAAALILTVLPLMFALSLGNQTYSWASPQVTGLLAFAALMLPLFLLIERRASQPILPLSLFTNPIFTVVAIATFLTGMGMFGSILFIPLFVQGVSGSSATNSGLVLAPMMVAGVIGSIIGGQILSRWRHYRYLAVGGVGLMTAGMALLPLMDGTTSNGEVTRNLILIGLGLGISFPVFTIVVQNAFPYSLMGLVTAFVQFFRSTGGSLGVTVLGALLATRLSGNLLSSLSQETQQTIGDEQLAELQNPNVLVSPGALERLEEHFAGIGEGGPDLLETVLATLREALANSLHEVFVVAAVLVGLALLALVFLKEIPLRKTLLTSSESLSETAS